MKNVRDLRASGTATAPDLLGNGRQSEPLLYRVSDVTELLGLSRTVVFDLLRTGRLRSVKEGRTPAAPGLGRSRVRRAPGTGDRLMAARRSRGDGGLH